MLEDIGRQNLLAIALTYAEATGLALTTVSRKFHGSHGFFDDFRIGKVSITFSKHDEIVSEFQKRWPPDTPWPIVWTVTAAPAGNAA